MTRTVLLGRATLYGAVAAGEPGAHRALAIFKDELIRTLQLCGVTAAAQVDAARLFGSRPFGGSPAGD